MNDSGKDVRPCCLMMGKYEDFLCIPTIVPLNVTSPVVHPTLLPVSWYDYLPITHFPTHDL